MKGNTAKKKILVIAMPFSVHTERWLSSISFLELDVYFFSSFKYAKPTIGLENVVYCDFSDNIPKDSDRNLAIDYFGEFLKAFPYVARLFGKLRRKLRCEKDYSFYLKQLIDIVKPDIIHTLESQHAGYLLLNAMNKFGSLKTYKWVHSTWGIDLHYFRDKEGHRKKLGAMFREVDKYCAEGRRDQTLAQDLGFEKDVFIFPSVGGFFDIEPFQSKPSSRNMVLLKGYENEVRKSINAFKALEKSNIISTDLDIYIYGASEVLIDYVLKSPLSHKVKYGEELSHDKMINITAQSMVSITNNLSDGLPNSFIEALATGAFPIQSNTSMADEWIEGYSTGVLVEPTNIDEIANAIDFALDNPELLDKAAVLNRKKFEEEFDKNKISSSLKKLYSE